MSIAQPEKAEIRSVEGKKYYAHIVEKSQTLYAIQNLYGVSLKDIQDSNPNMDENIQIGEVILIPISLDDEGFYGKHTVEKGETLYGISKKYKCTVGELMNVNPEIGDEGINIGQIIRYPFSEQEIKKNQSLEKINADPVVKTDNQVQQNQWQDSIVNHTVLKHETLYSISKRYMVTMDEIKKINNNKNLSLKEGDVIKIPVKKVNYDIVTNPLENQDIDTTLAYDYQKKETYNIAILAPLMLAANHSHMNKMLKPGEIADLHPTTKIAIDFYHGFMIAVDSLSKAGMSVNIYVYDTKKDTATVKEILAKSEWKDMDMVFGPFYKNTCQVTAEFCKLNKIPMIIPFKTDSEILYQNPYVFKSTSSHLSQTKGMIDYIVENQSQYNITIIKPLDSEKAIYDYARDLFNENIKTKSGAYNSSIVELSQGNANGRDINAYLKKDTVNVVIVPSLNLKFIAGMFTRLNNVLNLNPYAKNMKIIVFGYEDWNNMDDLDLKHRMRLNQHYVSYRYVDYNNEKVKPLLIQYRNMYGTDPDIYGIQGFDLGFYFLSALYLNGKSFPSRISEHNLDLVQCKFNFNAISEENGYENDYSCIVKYENYEMKILKW